MTGGDILETLLSVSPYVLPLVVWTLVGSAVAQSGSWMRLAVFGVVSFVLFLWVFRDALKAGGPVDESHDWFLSGITCLFYGGYGLTVGGIFVFLTFVRANELHRQDIGEATGAR